MRTILRNKNNSNNNTNNKNNYSDNKNNNNKQKNSIICSIFREWVLLFYSIFGRCHFICARIKSYEYVRLHGANMILVAFFVAVVVVEVQMNILLSLISISF